VVTNGYGHSTSKYKAKFVGFWRALFRPEQINAVAVSYEYEAYDYEYGEGATYSERYSNGRKVNVRTLTGRRYVPNKRVFKIAQ